MFKAIRMVFEFIGGFFKFMTELLEWINSELDEVNDHLEKSNEEMRRKRLEKDSPKMPEELEGKRQEIGKWEIRGITDVTKIHAFFALVSGSFLLGFTPLLRTLLKRGWTYPKQRFGDGLEHIEDLAYVHE